MVLLQGDKIDIEDLPSNIRIHYGDRKMAVTSDDWNLQRKLAGMEKDIISQALSEFGSQRKAAGPLGVNHSTLSRKIKKYNIQTTK